MIEAIPYFILNLIAFGLIEYNSRFQQKYCMLLRWNITWNSLLYVKLECPQMLLKLKLYTLNTWRLQNMFGWSKKFL